MPLHAVLLLAAFAMVALTHWQLRDLKPSHLAPQLTLSPAVFQGIIGAWRNAGVLERYRRFLYLDFLTLASYGLGGHLWVSGTSCFDGLGDPGRPLAAWLLPLAACADAVENLIHLRLTSSRAAPSAAGPYRLAGMATRFKFALLGLFAAALAIASLPHAMALLQRVGA